MRRRHFLVREVDGKYELKEIDPAIADGINRFGTRVGNCYSYYSVESIHWTFYFMNTHISRERADQIAAELTEQFLNGERK